MTKAICAWCGKDLGDRDWGEGVTHGICTECKRTELEREGLADETNQELRGL